jgi:hypothetical protein
MIITPYVSFARPGNTTAYQDTDLLANDVDAADVVPLRFGVSKLARGNGRIIGARIFKDHQTFTNFNVTLHLFSVAPVVTNGDNGALAVSTAEHYLGAIAMDASTGAFVSSTDGIKAFRLTTPISFDLELNADAGRILYGLLEAKAAYSPQNAEVFKVWLEIEDDQG